MALNAISRTDEQLLTWYFTAGLCAFERSIQGSIESRVTNGGHEPCPNCEGEGWIRLHVFECPECTDGYMYPPKHAKPRDTEEHGEAFQVVDHQPYACTRCRVRGRNGEWEKRGRRVVYESPGKRVRGFLVKDTCELCQGLGVVGRDGHAMVQSGSRWLYGVGGALIEIPSDGIPANPMGYEVRNAPPDPDDRALRAYGVVARRLGKMRERDVLVLFARFGVGVPWDRQSPTEERDLERERLCLLDDPTWPVMTLTRIGKRTLSRYAEKCPPDVGSVREEYSKEFDFRKTWEHMTPPERLRMLTKMPETLVAPGVWSEMRRQASQLLEGAILAWNVAKLRSHTMDPPKRRKRRRRPVQEKRLEPRNGSWEARVLGLQRLFEVEVRAA